MPDTLEAALAALTALHPKKIDLGLERIERVLETLGRPQYRLPPVVHVAGTNGKGSTLAFLRAMAEAEGLKCHVYTSPHLVHFRERITIASEPIADDMLIDVLTRVRDANGDHPLSFFEATTAAALLAFSENPADLCLLETGLGGRYDATNVVDDPALIGITPIDYDHAEFLGRDLAGIAREKAGIFKWHAPAVIAPQNDLVNAVLDAEAAKLNIDPLVWGQDYRAYRQHGRLVFEEDNFVLDFPLPSLPGDHQVMNAGTAIAMARILSLSEKAIAKGLTNARWPARVQSLTTGPYAKIAIDSGAELWLDGGHNPHAARAIASTIAGFEANQPRPLILIMGMLANKDVGGFLDAFSGLASAVIGVSIEGHAALAPETLVELAQARGLLGHVADDMTKAIELAVDLGEVLSTETPRIAPRILICGSLYLAGEVLSASEVT